jgi:hypothetical protein
MTSLLLSVYQRELNQRVNHQTGLNINRLCGNRSSTGQNAIDKPALKTIMTNEEKKVSAVRAPPFMDGFRKGFDGLQRDKQK